MNPAFVFLINDFESLEKVIHKTETYKFIRIFIIKSKNLQLQKFYKKTDKIIIFNFDDNDNATLIRIVALHTEPTITHFIFMYDIDYSIDQLIHQISEKNENESYLIVSRNYLAMHGFSFERKKNLNFDPLQLFEEIDRALKGEKVKDHIFNKALEELLPYAEYDYDFTFEKLEFKIKNLFKLKYKKNNIKYFVSFDNKSDSVNKNILFTLSDLQNYKFVIRRDDGLNCYIF